MIHPLSWSPSCYEPSPPISAPEGRSDLVIRQADRAGEIRDTRAQACIERYQRIITAMLDAPASASWAAHETDTVGDEFKISASLENGPGTFAIALKTEAEQRPVRDPCTLETESAVSYGTYVVRYTSIEQSGLSIYWNDSAVLMMVPSPYANIGLFYHGCDPDTRTSFGYVTRYNNEDPVGCWKDGQFVSCEGVSLDPLFNL